MRKDSREMQDTSRVHAWLVLGKTLRALATRAAESLKSSRITRCFDHGDQCLICALHLCALPICISKKPNAKSLVLLYV
jgi:hypothetical protein